MNLFQMSERSGLIEIGPQRQTPESAQQPEKTDLIWVNRL